MNRTTLVPPIRSLWIRVGRGFFVAMRYLYVCLEVAQKCHEVTSSASWTGSNVSRCGSNPAKWLKKSGRRRAPAARPPASCQEATPFFAQATCFSSVKHPRTSVFLSQQGLSQKRLRKGHFRSRHVDWMNDGYARSQMSWNCTSAAFIIV
ncbi:hypothetical protein ALCH109712_09625 [Alkalicoccus chagannorensis]